MRICSNEQTGFGEAVAKRALLGDRPPAIRYPLLVLMGCSAAAALAGLVMMLLLATTTSAHAERVKDLASVAGVRGNQLVGYGLVVGLDGTGDQTSQAPFTIQSIRNMLAKFGVTIPANV